MNGRTAKTAGRGSAKKKSTAKAAPKSRASTSCNVIDTCTVTVEPLHVDANKEVTCKMTGDCVIGGAVVLPRNGTVDITFNLVTGPGGSYEFHPQKPFTNRPNGCPPALPGGTVTNPFSSGAKGPTSITVQAGPVNGMAYSFYRLNFIDDFACDPIIIRD